MNPTRTGIIAALKMMGADITELDARIVGGEPVADLRVRHAPLSAIEVPPELTPSMIDEYPVLFVAAAFATGTTIARGAEELRVKESDRITAMANALGACASVAREFEDGMAVTGAGGAPIPGGATIATLLDHRIAMSMTIAALHARDPITLDDAAPRRDELSRVLRHAGEAGSHGMIIAVDGPAASGKGTIARALARHYGLPHLDTGLLYRAWRRRCDRCTSTPRRKPMRVAACSSSTTACSPIPACAMTRRASSPRSCRPIRWSAPPCSSGRSGSRSSRAARSSTARHRHGHRARRRRQAVRKGQFAGAGAAAT